MSDYADLARQSVLSQFGIEAAEYYDRHFSQDDLIEFVGSNCKDFDDDMVWDCEWDGYSRRCVCGNRRVCWNWENSILYAEAY